MTENLISLTLPGAFVLLMQKPNGSKYHNSMAPPVVAAAELGELALRERVALEDKKIHLRDTSPSGTEWVDHVLAELDKKTNHGNKPLGVHRWVSLRGNSILRKHRDVLVGRELLDHEQDSVLGVPRNRYVPHAATRDGILDEMHRATREERCDDRLALLCSLVHASTAASSLGFDRQERAKLEEISKGEALAKSVQQTVAVLTAVALPGAAASSGTS